MNDPILSQLRGMVIFARVVDSGSFTQAAARLGVSRAVVSYQIKQLEQQLGLRLLNRSTRKISLTAAGSQYHESCRRIALEAEQANRLMENLREEAVGRIAIACPVNLGMRWVVPVANLFRKQYPKIKLDLNFSEGIANVVEEGIDLAIRAGPLTDSELKSVRVATVTRHICASPDYLSHYGWPQSPEQLTGHEWVLYSRTSDKLNLIKGGEETTVTVNGSLRTNNAAARLQFVLSGQGIGVLPHYDATPALKQGELVELLPDYDLPSLDLFAVFPAGATDAKASRLMLQMLRQNPPEDI